MEYFPGSTSELIKGVYWSQDFRMIELKVAWKLLNHSFGIWRHAILKIELLCNSSSSCDAIANAALASVLKAVHFHYFPASSSRPFAWLPVLNLEYSLQGGHCSSLQWLFPF